VWTDSWLSIAGVGCGLTGAGAGAKQARKVIVGEASRCGEDKYASFEGPGGQRSQVWATWWLLTVHSCNKVRIDLQADKSPVVVKGPFFPRVMNPRYRIRGTNV
jgi:hypothetical protein